MSQGSYAVAFAEEDAVSRAVNELAHQGYARESMSIATRSEKVLRTLTRDLGVLPIDDAVEHEGMFADLARATGKREPKPAGAFQHLLIERGVDDERAQYFVERVRAGNIVLIVPIAKADESALASIIAQGGDLGHANGAGLVATIPLRREILDLRKVSVVTNEVVVRTEIEIEKKTIELELESEFFVIERYDPRTPELPPQITRIPIRHDEAIVNKQTIVTAEVRVRTEQRVDSSVIEETVRHEELHVDEPSVRA